MLQMGFHMATQEAEFSIQNSFRVDFATPVHNMMSKPVEVGAPFFSAQESFFLTLITKQTWDSSTDTSGLEAAEQNLSGISHMRFSRLFSSQVAVTRLCQLPLLTEPPLPGRLRGHLTEFGLQVFFLFCPCFLMVIVRGRGSFCNQGVSVSVLILFSLFSPSTQSQERWKPCCCLSLSLPKHSYLWRVSWGQEISAILVFSLFLGTLRDLAIL